MSTEPMGIPPSTHPFCASSIAAAMNLSIMPYLPLSSGPGFSSCPSYHRGGAPAHEDEDRKDRPIPLVAIRRHRKVIADHDEHHWNGHEGVVFRPQLCAGGKREVGLFPL